MKILLIEDDLGIITPLTAYLVQAGHIVSTCTDGSQALDFFAREKPQLLLLDINLPGKNGVEICEEIRKTSLVPIIVVSARESEDDKVRLLELGADDYVAKPFSPRELVARIMAVAKRSEDRRESSSGKKERNLTFGRITLDARAMTVMISDEMIRVTKTEFSLIEYFIKNAKIVIKREALMKNIIGYDHYLYDRTIDTHIKNLRKKLE